MMEEKQREIVREELQRVLASPRLSATPRLAGFLRLVVEMSLDGREEEIKEYLIGTEVYRRGVHFDPKVDSIVRVEAYRLRGRLEEYYAGLESPPAVRIELTKGTYVPRFHFQRNDSAAPIAEPLATAPATRRRWLAWAGAGALGAAGAGGGFTGVGAKSKARRAICTPPAGRPLSQGLSGCASLTNWADCCRTSNSLRRRISTNCAPETGFIRR